MPPRAKPKGRPSTLPEPWRSLALGAGGVGALADRFGVSPQTVYRWAHGLMAMRGPAKKILDALTRGGEL
jgi:DNA-binding transcriptional regulator YdaS (Cro superfamily)